jgi:hypothetical protein
MTSITLEEAPVSFLSFLFMKTSTDVDSCNSEKHLCFLICGRCHT